MLLVQCSYYISQPTMFHVRVENIDSKFLVSKYIKMQAQIWHESKKFTLTKLMVTHNNMCRRCRQRDMKKLELPGPSHAPIASNAQWCEVAANWEQPIIRGPQRRHVSANLRFLHLVQPKSRGRWIYIDCIIHFNIFVGLQRDILGPNDTMPDFEN